MTVSILTRPCGRVLQIKDDLDGVASKFQSSPGLAAGCFATNISGSCCPLRFQSSPGLAAGCFVPTSSFSLPSVCFNPHPALRPGASNEVLLAPKQQFSFQSSPGLAAGCFAVISTSCIWGCKFQSSPGLAAGCFRP